MSLVLFLFLAFSFLIFFFSGAMGYLHMLQLNSYRYERYIKWLTGKKEKLFAFPSLLVLISFFLVFKNLEVVSLSASFLFLFSLIFVLRKKKAKKPLVLTARVKRLIACLLILAILIILVALSFKDNVILVVTAFTSASFLLPYMVLLALFIMAPVEKMIADYYYNDAKKILRGMKDLIVIGVTGSFGKTSMKHIIASILSEKYDVLMTPGSFNTTMGVVRTIRENLKATHKVFVVEMGAKNKGDIKEICDLVNPRYGVISSIGPQHLETFLSIENIISTKFELADEVFKNGGTMFLNYNNEYIKNYGYKGEFISFGSKDGCDYKAENMKYTSRGCTFRVNDCELKTSLLGEFSAVNIAGGYALAEYFGVEKESVKAAVRRLSAPEHRLKLIKHQRYTVIDDAYNSNPSGAKAALETLALFEERKILVTPGMVELGSEQDRLNKEFGEKAASCADYIVLVGEKQAGPIKAGVLSKGFDEGRLYVAKDIYDAFNYVYKITDVPSVVLLENDLPDNFL